MCVPQAHPRHGDVADVHRLVHVLNYACYRINIHTNREIYDWRGENVNGRMSAQSSAFEPLHFVRSMRKLERLRRNVSLRVTHDALPHRAPSTRCTAGSVHHVWLQVSLAEYPSLFLWGQSLLLLRADVDAALFDVVRHHNADLDYAGVVPPPQDAATLHQRQPRFVSRLSALNLGHPAAELRSRAP